MTDLATLNTTNENWMQLENPYNGEMLNIFIKLASMDSEVYKKQLRKQQDRRLKKGIRNAKAEELENEQIELLVACTLEWKEVDEKGKDKKTLTFNGDELDCTAQNARKIYKEAPWIREQVDEYVGDRSNFLGEQ